MSGAVPSGSRRIIWPRFDRLLPLHAHWHRAATTLEANGILAELEDLVHAINRDLRAARRPERVVYDGDTPLLCVMRDEQVLLTADLANA